MDEQRAVLFWVFVSFFIIIGAVSLLAVIGVLKTDDRFRRWAISCFVVGVAGAMFGLFKVVFLAEVPILVTLVPPQEERTNPLNLLGGQYRYDELTSSGGMKSQSGQVEIALEAGGWQAKLPQRVVDKAVELMFKDENEQWWGVHPFYPTHNRQNLVKRLPPQQSAELLSFARTPGGNTFTTAAKPAFAEERQQSPSLTAKTETPLKFDNYARRIGSQSGRTYYQWRVFLDEPRSVLDTVRQVEYVLHPTFPEPFQVRTDPSSKFALETTGWGQFTILITVRYKNGAAQKTTYYLNLNKGWPK